MSSPTAGYSGTPLPRKLGIKPGHRVAAVQAPDGFTATLGELPEGVSLESTAGEARAFDVVLFFSAELAELQEAFPGLAGAIKMNGALWIAWPKKASKRPTSLSDSLVRELGLTGGLVDTKVCAIDAVWSGLKFIVRVRDRG